MHQPSRRNHQPQHSARYRRMEPVDIAQFGSTNDDTAVLSPRNTRPTTTTPQSAPISPLLKSSTTHSRSIAFSSQTAVGSLTSDLAAVEEVLADVDFITQENDGKKKSAFPTSLPSLTTTPSSDETVGMTSVSAVTSPARQHLRIFVDNVKSGDADGEDSLAASVYDNYANHNQNWDGEKENMRPGKFQFYLDTNDDQETAREPDTRETLMNDKQVGSNLDGTEGGRKSGRIGGEPNKELRVTLAPNDQNNQTPGRSPTLRSRSRSRPSSPRCSLIDVAGAAPSQLDGNGAALGAEAVNDEKKETKGYSGPSSRRTVLIIAGLFVVGLILVLSGIIVLTVEEHMAFRVAGCSFLGLGITFFIICLVLQKKNVKKLVNELEKDLYFLNVTDNKIWNMIFHFDEQLHWS